MTTTTFKRHTLRQLRTLIPGLLSIWYFSTPARVEELFRSHDAVARNTALGGVALAFTTISLFLYVMLLPVLKGIEPDYGSWRQSGELSIVIPILTSTIAVGWLLGVFALGSWSSLGFFESILAVSGLYALGFAILGLFPAPKVRRS